MQMQLLLNITRHRVKDGATDIRKAIWFLKAILKDEYKNDSNIG